MSIVGYARTSTAEQHAGLEAQVRDLEAAGAAVDAIFAEQVSSVADWPKLKEALRYVRKGDVLMVTKPDRLARSTADLLAIVAKLEGRGVGLLILSTGGQQLDTRAPTGKLMLTMLAAVAEFGRGLMLERQREDIAKAKAEGAYKGRQPTARAKTAMVLHLAAEGLTRQEIAARLGIGVASVYRILADASTAAAA
jgi:DNA invertase Pin-like site-specific DNA recombinase